MSRMMRVFAGLCGLLLLSTAVRAQDELVTELAQRHVDITAQFTGEKVLIFGAVCQPGNIIIKVSSPDETVAIARKAQYGPFWLTSGNFTVKGAPGLFYILSTQPVDKLLDADERERYGLSLKDSLNDAQVADVPDNVEDWKQSFLDLKDKDGHYRENGDAVRLVGAKLFSASVSLPAKLPLGEYKLTIYSVRDGKVVAQQSRSLDVREVRMERWVSNVAYTYPWTFGIAFVLLAMVLGLVLGIVLRKGGDD